MIETYVLSYVLSNELHSALINIVKDHETINILNLEDYKI